MIWNIGIEMKNKRLKRNKKILDLHIWTQERREISILNGKHKVIWKK